MDIISAGLALAVKILELVNTERSRALIQDAKNIQIEHQEECEKAYDQQDDAKIVSIEKRAVILMQAANNEFKNIQAKSS
jgi:hypothetical protein